MMTRVESLRGQLATSLVRMADLQRRAERGTSRDTVLPRVFDELQRSLAELETAVEELREQSTRLEAARLESEQERIRWQALFDLAPMPYILTDDRGVIRNVNDAGANVLAISRRFLIGKPITYFVDGRRAEFLEEVSRAASGTEPLTIDFTLRPRERAPYAARVTLRRFALPDGTTGLWWIVERTSAAIIGGNVAAATGDASTGTALQG